MGSTLHMDYLHTDMGSKHYAAEIESRFSGPDGEPLQGQEFLEQLYQVKQELLNGNFRFETPE